MKLKLPAYGKRLLDDRRAGSHPLEVTLVYGDKWFVGKDPRVCLKPDDYAPGTFDFCMLAGARVVVLDQMNAAADHDGKFYDLLREIAVAGALAIVQYPLSDERISLLEIAEGFRQRSRDKRTWPRWWDDEIDRGHRALLYDWLDDKRKAVNGRVAA